MQKLEALVLVSFTHCATARGLQKTYSKYFSNEIRQDISLANMCGMLNRLVKQKFISYKKATKEDIKKFTIGGKTNPKVRVGTRIYSITPKGKDEVMMLYNLIKMYRLSDKF